MVVICTDPIFVVYDLIRYPIASTIWGGWDGCTSPSTGKANGHVNRHTCNTPERVARLISGRDENRDHFDRYTPGPIGRSYFVKLHALHAQRLDPD